MNRKLVDALLNRGDRTEKPRQFGLTLMIDKGQMGPNAIADFVGTAGAHCDYAKIAWGSSLITGNLEEKLAAYRRASITPMLGGTLFEYAYLRNKLNELLDFACDQKLHIEISDGVIDLPRADKLRWIERFAKHVEVFSEIGGKINRQNHNWKQVIEEEFKAGTKKVVVEGREIGPVGQDIRSEFVDTVLDSTDHKNLVFEAFERKQQVYFIKRQGPNVNLGNIPPTDLLTLESFRLGLKEHTLQHTFDREKAAREHRSAERSSVTALRSR